MQVDRIRSVFLEATKNLSGGTGLLSIDQLAGMFGVSVRTIRRLHAAGYGPVRIRRSHRLMYRPSDVEAWLQTTQSTEEQA